jgi:hypothetical protein
MSASKMFIFLGLMVLAWACASKPTKLLVANCQALGSNLYSCEEIPQRDIQPKSR